MMKDKVFRRAGKAKSILLLAFACVFVFFLFAAINTFKEKPVFRAYAQTQTETDIATLNENKQFTYSGDSTADKETIVQFAKDYVEGLNLGGSYTISDEKYISSKIGNDGLFAFNVVIDGQSVAMKMVIPALAQPLIVDFAQSSNVVAMTGYNANISALNGKLKMTTKTISDADGFFLEYSTSVTGATSFNLGDYPFVKIRYKLSGCINAPFQLFFFRQSSSVYSYRNVNVNNGSADGDEMTVIFNLGVTNKTDIAVWQINETKGTRTEVPYSQVGGSDKNYACTGTASKFRLNLARTQGDRSATVSYIGHFPSFESASAYTQSNDAFESCSRYLSNNTLSCLWGDGQTQAEAENAAVKAIYNEFGLNCSVLKSDFIPSTVTKKGILTFDAIFDNDGKTEIVRNICLEVDEKPDDYHIFRFNDQNFLNKLYFNSSTKVIENNMLVTTMTKPTEETGYFFDIEMPKAYGQFYVQNYTYIRLRYKRNGIAPGSVFVYTDAKEGSSRVNVGWGKEEDTWYTSILCLDVKSYNVPYIINFNESTQQVEEVRTLVNYGIRADVFEGQIERLRINFGQRAWLERTTYLEYIALFPTLEDAWAFDAEYSTLKSNAEVCLSEYTGEEISYNAGNTQALAIEGIKAILAKKVGGVVDAQAVSYTPPVANVESGSITVNVKLYDSANKLAYEKSGLTFTISYVEEPAYTEEDLNNFAQALAEKEFFCAYADGATEALAVATFHALLESEFDSFTLDGYTVKSFTQPSVRSVGELVFACTIGYDGGNTSLSTAVDIALTVGEKPAQSIIFDFTEENIAKLSALSNAILTHEANGDNLILQSKTATAEDGFGFEIKMPEDLQQFYLQNYPYLKIRFKRNNTGRFQCYFFNESATAIGVNPSANFNTLHEASEVDTWLTVIFDMNGQTAYLYDVENGTLLYEKKASSMNSEFSGLSTKFRFNFGRGITVDRSAEIDYIGFFSSAEQAMGYNGDGIYSGYAFNGVELAIAQRAFTATPETIEMAVKIGAGNDRPMVLVSNRDTSDDYFSIETMAAGIVEVYYQGKVILSSNGSIYNGKWTQIAVTLQDGAAALYINGVQENENTEFSVNGSVFEKALVVASDYSLNNRLIGEMMHLRVFGTVCSAEQIKQMAFNRSVQESLTNIAHWNFTTPKFDKFADQIGNNAMVLSDDYGKKGHRFAGNDFIQSQTALTAAPKTIEFWMKHANADDTTVYTVLTNQNGTLDVETVGGKIKFTYGGNLLFTSKTIVGDGAWHHVAIVVDGNTVLLYLDGTVVLNTTATVNATVPTGNIYIGGNATKQEYFVGNLSDIRVWEVVRSSEAINAYMKDYIDAQTGLIASWRLDTQSYLVYEDYSGNGNAAKLYSDGWYHLENVETEYTVIQVADTQSYMFEAGDPDLVSDIYRWIADAQEEYNIVLVNHLGDVTQNNTPMEWSFADTAIKNIEGYIPYSIALGNHDYASPYTGIGAEFRDARNFIATFSLERLKQEGVEGYQFLEAYDDVNYAFFLTVDLGEGKSITYLYLVLEFGPKDEVLDWASDLLTANSNTPSVILTHSYYDANGNLAVYDSQKTGGDFADANEGLDIWNKIAATHDNVIMVNCGHAQALVSGVNTNNYGNSVVEILSDPSAAITGFPSTEGLIMLMCYNEDGTKMHTYYYSPIYDMYYNTNLEITFDMRTMN